MRFEEAYQGWTESHFTQEEAARLLGVSDRTFRRYLLRYEEQGLAGLIDKRLEQLSHRRAPVDEVISLTTLYITRYRGWNVKHFFSFYKKKHSGTRSYTWVKNMLQKEGVIKKSTREGVHRKKRERALLPGMMLHQDGSDHEWVPGIRWDLIVTMDDATSEHYSMFFVEEEGTASSFQGVKETIEKKGLFCSIYTDRGSHYWITPEAGGKVDKNNLTQFGRAMRQLGIEMIAAYSPEARGRSERAFRTHQERLPKELAMLGITTLAEANRYLAEVYMNAFNNEFAVPAAIEGSAFVSCLPGSIENILCEHYERIVGKNNCVSFEGLTLQIPKDNYRCHYNKVKVRIHRYVTGQLAIFHGPRKLAEYDSKGEIKVLLNEEAA
jgi:transposase